MLSGLSPDSPLGRVIEVRASEKPQELTQQARAMRSEWFVWLAENRKGALAPLTSFRQALGR